MRVQLDNVEGLAARFQYLDLSLSEAEQLTFFARFGNDIQELIASGFGRLEKTLARLLFLQESRNHIDEIDIIIFLDRTYRADEIGHFRLFCNLLFRHPKHDIFQVLFGSADKPERFDPNIAGRVSNPGFSNGIGGAQWEQRIADGDKWV